MRKKIKIITVVGARPNFIKVAPLFEEFKKHKKINPILIHTGQHYDYEMSQAFFDGLKIPKPNYNLEIGSALHGKQTGKTIIELEKVYLKEKPDLIVVVGDVNSTLAGALVAAKLHMPIAHIEAGLRSYKKTMPEEVNRVLTDHISDFLFCPTKTAEWNLKKEGIKKEVLYNVGDIMYDAFLYNIKIAQKKSEILERLKIKPKSYYLATVHRAENTNNKKKLKNIADSFCGIGNIIFPCHPRTEKYLKQYKLWKRLKQRVKVIKSLKYLDMLWLEKNAKKILTDSGGVQKETYFAKAPCITLRDETEWVETVKSGWNILVGDDKQKIIKAVKKFNPKKPQYKYFGDGKTAKRIVKILVNFLQNGK